MLNYPYLAKRDVFSKLQLHHVLLSVNKFNLNSVERRAYQTSTSIGNVHNSCTSSGFSQAVPLKESDIKTGSNKFHGVRRERSRSRDDVLNSSSKHGTNLLTHQSVD